MTGGRSGQTLRAAPPAAPLLLLLPELARTLGLRTTSAARRFVLREGVPHVRLGRKRIAVRAEALDAWLAAREEATRPPPSAPPAPPPEWARDLLARRRRGVRKKG